MNNSLLKNFLANLEAKIYVAGHQGMVGSAIIRQLEKLGFRNIIVVSRDELNLTNQKGVHTFFLKNK